MTQVELVSRMAEEAGISKSAAERAFDAFVKALKETVRAGESVKLYGLGVFKVAERNAKKGRNPRTGEVVEIPAKKSPKFIPSRTWRDEINS